MLNNIFCNNHDIIANFKNKRNGLDLLTQIDDDSLRVVFFDPQYRGVLDKMKYGNEGEKRGKQRSSLTQMDETTIHNFIEHINRVLVPSGYLFLWVDKFHLVEGIASWFDKTDLQTVDMITWNKMKMGMGYRSRRQAEYLVVVQKKPVLAKSTWSIHNIPDVWSEKVVKTHAHSKPVELQKQLIIATTQPGDFICDPASGGYSVFEACKQTNRNFIGGDIEFGDDVSENKNDDCEVIA